MSDRVAAERNLSPDAKSWIFKKAINYQEKQEINPEELENPQEREYSVSNVEDAISYDNY